MQETLRDEGLIPELGRKGNGNPLQHSCLGNPMDRRAWQVTPWGHRVRHSWVTEHRTVSFYIINFVFAHHVTIYLNNPMFLINLDCF